MTALLIAVLLASVPFALSVSEPTDRDILRGKTMVPRASYRGADFRSMGQVLNGHLQREAGLTTKDCSEFETADLRELLRTLFPYASSELLEIYADASDNRQRLEQSLEELEAKWEGIASTIRESGDPELTEVWRDGLCHQSVMWFVHHLSTDDREELKQLVTLPLLPLHKHTMPAESSTSAKAVHQVYNEHSTCQACHTGGINDQGKIDPPLTPTKEHPTWARLRRCDEPCTKCDVSYDPPCGACEGVGGPYYGDPVDDFTPVNCSIVATPDKVPEAERMSPLLPPQFQVYVQGTDRLVRKENPIANATKKKGAYSNIHGTMWYDFEPTAKIVRLRHDTYYDSEPYKTFAKGLVSEIHQQSREQMATNITGAMFSTVAAMSKMPKQGGCTCVPDPVGVPKYDSFKDATYMGRIKLEPIEFLNKTVIVDHYSKWFFHLFVDAEKESETYGLPLRFYSPYAGFAVYHTWILKDPVEIRYNVWNASLPSSPSKCMNVKNDPVCNNFDPTVAASSGDGLGDSDADTGAHHSFISAAWPFGGLDG